VSAKIDNVHLANPLEDLIPGPRGRLLATMVQLEAPVIIRALARFAGVAPQTALDLVNDLADAGIVSAERAGNAQMVALNRAHLIAESLICLGRTRARLVAKLTSELANWPELAAAWLFGSAARATGGRDSDVDIVLVAQYSIDSPSWAAAATQLIDGARTWTGNEAQLVEHTASSFSRLVRSDNALIVAIREDGMALSAKSDEFLRRLA
jgi:predicted nucleotidyltransferase